MYSLIRKRAPGSDLASHKKDEDERSGSSSDSILSDEEGSIGEYQDEEGDGEWSSSDSDEISLDASDSD